MTGLATHKMHHLWHNPRRWLVNCLHGYYDRISWKVRVWVATWLLMSLFGLTRPAFSSNALAWVLFLLASSSLLASTRRVMHFFSESSATYASCSINHLVAIQMLWDVGTILDALLSTPFTFLGVPRWARVTHSLIKWDYFGERSCSAYNHSTTPVLTDLTVQ